MPARPKPWYQLRDTTAPIACRSKNCAVCALAMLAERSSTGRFRLTPTEIRRKAGVSCYTGTGGVPYLNGATAVKSLTGGAVVLTVTNGTPGELRADLAAGRGAVVSLDYSALLGRRSACENDFGGGHAAYLNGQRIRDGIVQYDYFDPLCDGRYSYPRGFQWVDAAVIHRAAQIRSGWNGINYTVGRDTEGVHRQARARRIIRAAPSITAKALGELKYAEPYFVRKTVNGGDWGSNRDIWHAIARGTGTAYVIGGALT